MQATKNIWPYFIFHAAIQQNMTESQEINEFFKATSKGNQMITIMPL